jgi:hypothetical protein
MSDGRATTERQADRPSRSLIPTCTNLRGNPGDRLHAYGETDLDDGVQLQELIDETGEVVVMGIAHEDGDA